MRPTVPQRVSRSTAAPFRGSNCSREKKSTALSGFLLRARFASGGFELAWFARTAVILGLAMPARHTPLRARSAIQWHATRRNQPFKDLCRFLGTSRTTGYLWVSRYEELGNLRDLAERSRRPHQIPNRTTPDIERKVLELRARASWGARRLAALLSQQNIQLAESTVYSILRRHKRIGTENSSWAAWKIQALLADDPLPQLRRKIPNAR